jgi:hypothetical protein
VHRHRVGGEGVDGEDVERAGGWRARLSRASPSTIFAWGAQRVRKLKRVRATWTIAGSISKIRPVLARPRVAGERAAAEADDADPRRCGP